MTQPITMTEHRLDLLAAVRDDKVFRDAIGHDYISADRRVCAGIGTLANAGLVELLDAAHSQQVWRLTALGRAQVAIRVVDFGGNHITVETGPEDDVTVVATATRAKLAIGWVWQIAVAADGRVALVRCRAGRRHAVQVMRRLAAQVVAAELGEVTR